MRGMEYKFLGYALVGVFSALLYFACHAIPTWLLKRYKPGAEWWINAPISAVIARLIAAVRQGRQAGRQISRE